MMKRSILLLSLLLTLTCTDLFPQSKAEIKNSFYDAESWILFEAYKDALPLYLQLLKNNPDNANFKYRIGQCYINTPGEKDKAVSYLEDAVKNINPKYREGRFRESGAPFDAFYYLANAYRINNQLDKSIETYERFKRNMDTKIYDTAVVNLQIQSCINAKELMGRPNFIKRNNLGNLINDENSEFNPVVTDNENMIVYSRGEAFYDAILYSVKENGKWSAPHNMNEILKVDRDLFPTSISSDGKTLYLYSSADYDGKIYTSSFENGTWTPLSKLNDNINTKFWESHATVSHDNNKLYFTSNRKGTYGGLDIYVSQRDSTGDWGVAANLGPVINTPYNEESPFLSKDDKTLFYSSRGQFNMGGYDIFSSTMLKNGEWTAPVNAGYPLNSTDDDVFFKPANESYKGFYSIDSPDGYGKQDIYQIEIFSDDHPRKFTVSGISNVADLLSTYRDSIRISITSLKRPGQVMVVYTDPGNGEYEFNLPQGDYQLTYEGYGGEKAVSNLNLPLTYPSDNLLLPKTVLTRTDHTAELYVEGSRNLSVTKGDSILIKLKVEPVSQLTIENWSGDSILSSEKHFISSPDFNYRMAPRKGDNRVVFGLADRFNNTASDTVFITKGKDLPSKTLIRPEYSKIVSEKKSAAYLALLKNRADENTLRLINASEVGRHDFKKSDDLLLFLKTEASGRNIKPEMVDKLALKVAVMDNVLTQAAVNIMDEYSDGELKNNLTSLDIYKADLKTWSDLQRYINENSGGKITARELDDLAAAILAGVDPAIAIIREKILAFSENNEAGAVLQGSVAKTDLSKIFLRGKWLQSFWDESVKSGLSPEKLSGMFVIISTPPGTEREQFMTDLLEYTAEPLLSSLKTTDLKKEKIKTARDLVLFLTTAGDQVKYPGEAVFKSIANLIAAKNLPADSIKSQPIGGRCDNLWILWLIIGSLIIFFVILFKRRKKKEKEG